MQIFYQAKYAGALSGAIIAYFILFLLDGFPSPLSSIGLIIYPQIIIAIPLVIYFSYTTYKNYRLKKLS